MYVLSDKQIDYILYDIGARGVEMESLQQNLVDHVCCVIEQNLEANGDFESFYKKTIKTFYKDALWEIEEETLLLLTYKNYYTMKKVMINSGIASATFFIIGSLFKVMHWPGASALIILGMFIGAFLFLPLVFIFKKNETTESRGKVVLGMGVINGIVFCIYTLFKIMHWPGASTLWFITLGMFTLIFIPLYFFNGIRNQANKINTITTTLILIIVAGVFFLQTSLKSSKQVYIAKTQSYLLGQELIKRVQYIKNDSVHQSIELAKASNDIMKKCEEIKGMVIFDELGQKTIPENFENSFQWIEEGGLGDEFTPEREGYQIILDLKNSIDNYNTLNRNKKIPNIPDQLIKQHLLQYSNYNLLSALSQIELYVVLNEKQ